jgi:hypothetical protein
VAPRQKKSVKPSPKLKKLSKERNPFSLALRVVAEFDNLVNTHSTPSERTGESILIASPIFWALIQENHGRK